MAEAKPQAAAEQDPSMEEILQSIRRIIAEDEKSPANQNGAISSDVLELTQAVEDEGEPASVAGDHTPEGASVDVLASIENALAENVLDQEIPATPPPPPAPAMVVPGSDLSLVKPEEKPSFTTDYQFVPPPQLSVPGSDLSKAKEGRLLSDTPAAEAAAAFRKLAASANAAMAPSMDAPAFRSGVAMEDLMLELMRPLLKSWLDVHLPGIVERIVEREVKRLSGS